MKIALFGASGTIGQRIAREALNRGHEVTAIMRNPQRMPFSDPHLTATQGDVLDPESVAQTVIGHDAVVSAVGPTAGDPKMLVEAARSLLAGLPRAGVHRLLVVGGAGSLEVAPGQQVMDSPDFNPAWRPAAEAARDALDIYRADSNLDWTYLSPANLIQPGERTGRYRTGGDQLVQDEHGVSRISAEDYAVALMDEIERPQHARQRFTVAY